MPESLQTRPLSRPARCALVILSSPAMAGTAGFEELKGSQAIGCVMRFERSAIWELRRLAQGDQVAAAAKASGNR